jgi:hypothetical protein
MRHARPVSPTDTVRSSQSFKRNINPSWLISHQGTGARVAGFCEPAVEWAREMILDPEELVTLTNHGTMRLRSAVARAMMLPPKERRRATIIRESSPSVLKIEQIKNLAGRWEKAPVASG